LSGQQFIPDEYRVSASIWDRYSAFSNAESIPQPERKGELPIELEGEISGPELRSYLSSFLEQVLVPVLGDYCPFLEICIWDPFRTDSPENWALSGSGVNRIQKELAEYLAEIRRVGANLFHLLYRSLKKVDLKFEISTEGQVLSHFSDSNVVVSSDPDERERVRHELNAVRDAHKDFGSPVSTTYVYYIPSLFYPGRGGVGIGGLILVSSHNFSSRLIKELQSIIDSTLSKLGVQYLFDNFCRQSMLTAVAAIMARNMSHNIGSHALARVATGDIGIETGSSDPGEIAKKLCEIQDRRGRKKAWKRAVVWSKDVQILARYVQQRMDFIAQISTEWPGGSESAYLLKDLMRWFLSQKHLMDFVAKSEGLGAHLFGAETDPPVGCNASEDLEEPVDRSADATANQAENTSTEDAAPDIRLHAFVVPLEIWDDSPSGDKNSIESRLLQIMKHCSDQKGKAGLLGCKPPEAPVASGAETLDSDEHPCRRILLHTPRSGEADCRVDEDMLLSVPGGIVGYHAFYVILENIIRNAAKHGFTMVDKSRIKDPHLDIAIEVFYDPEESVGIWTEQRGKVHARLIRIYDNVSRVSNDREKCDDDEDRGTRGSSEADINSILEDSLIEIESGKLKKENWGLAEMRIAAGFLQRRDVEHIGAVHDIASRHRQSVVGEETQSMLQLAQTKDGSGAIIRCVRSPLDTLGYEFYIPKPRTVGIVCKT
jgi:hypothetical protein